MQTVTYSFEDLPPVNEDELNTLRKMNNSDIDFSDIPALSKEQMQIMLEKGKSVRQKLPNTYIDDDILQVFKKKGPDWQKNLNNFLRTAVSTFAL